MKLIKQLKSLKYLMVLVISFLTLEISFREISKNSLHHFFNTEYDTFWELYFLERVSSKEDPLYSLFQYDPRLGFNLKPNSQYKNNSLSIIVNKNGYRGIERTSKENSNILVLGDSLTFAPNSNEGETWTDILNENFKKLHTNKQALNLAVGGYGIDQMLLTLKSSLKKYKTKLVILSFSDVSLQRILLGMRDFQRPQFKLRNNKLELVKNNILTPQELRYKLDRKYLYTPRIITWLADLLETFQNRGDPQRTHLLFPLGKALVDEANKLAINYGANFILLHLARTPQINDSSLQKDLGEYFVDYLKREGSHYPIILTRDYFLKQKKIWEMKGTHYSKKESELVANVVLNYLSNKNEIASY